MSQKLSRSVTNQFLPAANQDCIPCPEGLLLDRADINLWTSRNIALVLSEPEVLIDALVLIKDGKPATEVLVQITKQYQLSDHEVRELKELLDLLMQEAGLA